MQKLVAEIMAAWRRADRLASTMPDGSPERDAAQRAADRLRDAYQELTHSGVATQISSAEARLLVADAAADLD
jgi:type IV pilus biogenesis protein CpaD/CtpE